MECLCLAAEPATPSLNGADLGFLGAWLFRFGNPDFGGWISLDFLGFSRPNRDLSMGYADFSRKFFSHRFWRRESAIGTAPAIWHAERTKLLIGRA
jgi:hypothetical protein